REYRGSGPSNVARRRSGGGRRWHPRQRRVEYTRCRVKIRLSRCSIRWREQASWSRLTPWLRFRTRRASAWRARKTAGALVCHEAVAAPSEDSSCERVGAGDRSRQRACLQCPAQSRVQLYVRPAEAPEFLQLLSSLPLYEQDFFTVVHVAQMKFNHFVWRRLNPAANERRVNRQFSMSAIDQHAKLHLARTALAKSRVH